MAENLIEGKKILIVDDEPDILETLEDLLSMCDVVKATTFEDARKKLEGHNFDIAILDIMGVEGFKLLELAKKRDVIAVMLTAHALSPENIIKSYNEGAASYLPKEELYNITIFLNDVLEAKKKGRDPWWRWLSRLANFWKNEFSPDWQHHDEEFWKKFKNL